MIKDCLKKKVATEVSDMVTDVYLNDGIKAENVRTTTDDSNIATVKFGVPKKISLKCDLGAYDKAGKGGSYVDWCVLREKNDMDVEKVVNEPNLLLNSNGDNLTGFEKWGDCSLDLTENSTIYVKNDGMANNYGIRTLSVNVKKGTEYILAAEVGSCYDTKNFNYCYILYSNGATQPLGTMGFDSSSSELSDGFIKFIPQKNDDKAKISIGVDTRIEPNKSSSGFLIRKMHMREGREFKEYQKAPQDYINHPSNLIKTSEPKATSKPDENPFFKFQSKEQNYEYFNLKEDTEYVLMANAKASSDGPTQIVLENPPELSFKQSLIFESTEEEIKHLTFKTPKYINGIDEVNRIKIMSDEDVLIDSELYFKVQSETDFSYRIEVNGK